MAIINLLQAHLAFGHVPLLDHTDFSLEAGERVGLIGRNGTGKSSMLKIIAGMDKPDDGELQVQRGTRIAYVAQEPNLKPTDTVFEAASEGVAWTKGLIEQYMTGEGDLSELQTQIESNDGWNWEQRVTQTLQQLHLNPHALVSTLSGGTKKRVALAQALVQQPDVLLLDEPTNHLDLDSIAWLEGLLNGFGGSVLLITHDRAFLDGVCTRIVELDRGILRSYPGNFTAYETRKAEEMRDEALANARADKLLAQEEIWIRKGVEARRTRAVARIERLTVLRGERADRRDPLGRARLDVDSGATSGKIVAELQHVYKGFGSGAAEKRIVNNFSATILRGDKIGLLGPNGAGKTTLLKLILGEIQADPQPADHPAKDVFKLRQGANLSVAYFDQMRDNLDLDATLEDFISPGSEWVEIGTQRKHVKSYLSDFLFSPQRANSPVRSLSGGERNRLLLARLFARPANVLVLDEPTNDLDIDTLELLEDLLQSYDGTVFLVSHDRRFLDNVVTSIIAYEATEDEPGMWREYEGGVQDWLVQTERRKQAVAKAARENSREGGRDSARSGGGKDTAKLDGKGPAGGSAAASGQSIDAKNIATKDGGGWTSEQKAPKVAKKLSYKDQRELDALPALTAALEAEQKKIQGQLADGQLYAKEPAQAAQLAARDAAIEAELMVCLERMEALG